MVVNLIGGKSWKIDDYYVGFFASINNILNQNKKIIGLGASTKGNILLQFCEDLQLYHPN